MGKYDRCQAYVCGTVNSKAITGSQKNQTKGSEAGHDQETFGTTPGIHDLSDGNVHRRGERVGHGSRDTRQGVRSERTGDVGTQAAEDRGLEGVDKVQEPDAVEIRH